MEEAAADHRRGLAEVCAVKSGSPKKCLTINGPASKKNLLTTSTGNVLQFKPKMPPGIAVQNPEIDKSSSSLSAQIRFEKLSKSQHCAAQGPKFEAKCVGGGAGGGCRCWLRMVVIGAKTASVVAAVVNIPVTMSDVRRPSIPRAVPPPSPVGKRSSL